MYITLKRFLRPALMTMNQIETNFSGGGLDLRDYIIEYWIITRQHLA